MNIAIAQTNPIIGDFIGNIQKMVALARKAESSGCSLIIFPELAICGYPPQDLLERNSFLADHDQALLDLTRQITDIGVICGAITRHTGPVGKPLHNSAILLENGQWQAIHKRLLPTYDVFDESRYFEPAQSSRVLDFHGLQLGITICEDVFNEPKLMSKLISSYSGDLGSEKTPYKVNPVAELTANKSGIDILINIAASPFHSGKTPAKSDFFSRLALSHKVPIIYVNQVGGQDSLVFDGHSLVVDVSGKVVAKAKDFQEDLILVSTDTWQQIPLSDPETIDKNSSDRQPSETEDHAAEDIFKALVLGTHDYVHKCGFKKVVLGLSGGIDSALTAAVGVWALGAENVLGIALPSPYSSQGSIDDAEQLAKNLNIEFQVIPIHEIFATYTTTLSPYFKDQQVDVTEQNIQARIRGNLLMAISNKFGRLLLSTGNKSEMAVGYCTLYGDMSGGLSVISDVPKMMVYRICRYLNTAKEIIPWPTIDKPPSAELAPNQKDQDDLPSYEILDAILEAHLEEHQGLKEIVAQGFNKEIVEDVLRRVRLNEHKRKQAPPGLKVTSKAFGYGRRYPTTQKYKECE
jgi:NAD+ synthase (glutamine-hydrolysing)